MNYKVAIAKISSVIFLSVFFKNQKLTESNFSAQFPFSEKPKNPSKIGFFGSCEKFNPVMSFFNLKIAHVFYDSEEAACLRKILLFSY